MSLMPEIRSELNSSVSRYNSLGWWDVYELELDNTAPWDLLMGFLREYPQICDAFTNTSHYAKLPACLNRLVSTSILDIFFNDYLPNIHTSICSTWSPGRSLSKTVR